MTEFKDTAVAAEKTVTEVSKRPTPKKTRRKSVPKANKSSAVATTRVNPRIWLTAKRLERTLRVQPKIVSYNHVEFSIKK